MRGRLTVRLRRCRVPRTEPSASPWSGHPNVRRFPPPAPGTRTATPSQHEPSEVPPMPEYGYFLSCEEFGPADLVEQARMAEQAGFESLWISDHFHPWNDQQGESPFVWSVIGAVSQVCSLPITTAVTCPTVRVHPAIVAQAAATSAVLSGGTFILGVGSGEALNEHVTGERWPDATVRL